MELTIFDVIRRPRVSDKAHHLNRLRNQLVLEVHNHATKPMIKRAVEQLFSVKVKDVRTLVRKYRRGTGLRKTKGSKPSWTSMKLAYLSLAEGYSLNLFDQVGVAGADKTNK